MFVIISHPCLLLQLDPPGIEEGEGEGCDIDGSGSDGEERDEREERGERTPAC